MRSRNVTTTTLTKREQILLLVADLGWDYDRMSSCGRETYDKLCDLLEVS
jgi:hypothetical protein